jgi:hypothetical protein
MGCRQLRRRCPRAPPPRRTTSRTTAPVCRHWAWADLMRRAFDIDALACPRCGGRLRLIATVEAPRRDSRNPGRWYRVAGAVGSGAVVRAGAEHQPRRGNRGLSASGRRLRRGLFARVVGAVPSSGPSALLPSRNPLTGRLSALYLGAERENRPLPWSDRAGGRAC